MKLILITKEDWKDANLGVKLFNVVFNLVTLLVITVTILDLLDWIGAF